MFEHWIEPTGDFLVNNAYLGPDRIGMHLALPTEIHPKPGIRKIALIGADRRWAKMVRRHLYQFTFKMQDLQLYDLGDFRRSDPDFIVGPIIELLSSNICPIIVGAHLPMVRSLQQGLIHLKRTFHPLFIHESIPPGIISSSAAVVAVQQHLLPVKVPSHITTMHLSEVRNNMSDAETFVRDSNAIILDASALSLADMPAQKSESSSGLWTEEACMLLRYAGLHPATKAVMFTGHDPISLQMNSSANTTAQMIWYFLEGYYQCIAEDPARSTHCTRYEVQLEGYEIGFTFFKSERTARWWVQVNASSKHEPVFPCTFRDYQSAMNGHISQRLINCTNASLKSTQEIL